jgi:hypothetical protein
MGDSKHDDDEQVLDDLEADDAEDVKGGKRASPIRNSPLRSSPLQKP